MLPLPSFATGKPMITKAAMEQHAFKKNAWQLSLCDDGNSALESGNDDESDNKCELG